ncbi:MAG: tRNA dihydrouridine synthase DusB [Firmicutes bacterium]|jgi:nifR3 family TIM-barrel protein|nr:tRNA dihydrouridine synthase DusB [Bacillota bacterium]MCL5972683.1 tRNA dihydrouridine synthase DusB [Bacillota bacterium]
MDIGNISIDPPVMLAPMAGVSNRAFRAVARKQGATLCITEMVNANALLHHSAKSYWLMEIDPGESPVGIQIAGADPDAMAEAAIAAAKQGAHLIDINMGCPVPKVVKNGAGSALLNDMDGAVRVVQTVVQSVEIPVTVKMRAGWDDNHITAPQLAEAFERVGAQAIFLHARTREDQYRRPANWQYVKRVKERVSIPVVGNGDVETPQDALRMLEQTGADGVMIGRASFGDPWVFQRISYFLQTGQPLPAPSAEQRAGMALWHVQRMVEIKGESTGIAEMRKQLAWYLKGTPGSAAYRAQCTKITTEQDARTLVAEWLDHARNEALSWN